MRYLPAGFLFGLGNEVPGLVQGLVVVAGQVLDVGFRLFHDVADFLRVVGAKFVAPLGLDVLDDALGLRLFGLEGVDPLH